MSAARGSGSRPDMPPPPVVETGAAVTTAPTPARDTYARLWRWHFYAAFLVVPFVLWQAVTGTLYLWHEQLADRMHRELRLVEAAGPRAAWADQLAVAEIAAGGLPLSHVAIPAEPGRATMVVFRAPNGLPTPVFVDPRDASVLGRVEPLHWLPGLTRALHGGWPVQPWGSVVLELGASWAIVMVLTGLCLWWPRHAQGLAGVLYPRLRAGSRTFWRDVHAVAGAWVAFAVLAFLVTALPWTTVWGGRVLGPLQSATGQDAPVAASHGPTGLRSTLVDGREPASLDELVALARREGVAGDLEVRFGRTADAPVVVRSVLDRASDERHLVVDRGTRAVLARAGWAEFPPLARAIATGVDLHEGTLFGRANRWFNTAVSATLIWLAVSGFVGWWRRRPGGGLAAPPRPRTPMRRGVLAAGVVLCVALPMLGLSVLALLAVDAAVRRVRLGSAGA